MQLVINLTDAEAKALAWVALDPQEYANNAIKERCRHAIDEIYFSEIEKMTMDPEVVSIPTDKSIVVLAANIESAAEKQTKLGKFIPPGETDPKEAL